MKFKMLFDCWYQGYSFEIDDILLKEVHFSKYAGQLKDSIKSPGRTLLKTELNDDVISKLEQIKYTYPTMDPKRIKTVYKQVFNLDVE